MRRFLISLTFVLFAVGPALPDAAQAQEVLLAQSKRKKSKRKKQAEEEASKQAEDAAKAASAQTQVAGASATKAASDEAEKAGENAEAEGAEEAPAPAETTGAARVPLAANFSNAEIITAGSVFTLGMGLLVFGPDLLGAPDPSIGIPEVGSFDYDTSARFHGDLVNPGKFLFGVPDYTGLIAFPVGGTLFYMGSAAYFWGTGETVFGQSVNIDHSAIGFIEAMGWTALATGVTKQLTGRERPYKALNRREFQPEETPDSNVSFFSGHTSISFAAASYMALDLSDHLMQGGSGWWTGRFLPFFSLYGLASLVGVSRVYDQKHWASDVLIGAAVGGLIGNLTYVAHFDTDGNPRIRNPEALDVEVSLAPITTVSGDQGVGLVGSW